MHGHGQHRPLRPLRAARAQPRVMVVGNLGRQGSWIKDKDKRSVWEKFETVLRQRVELRGTVGGCRLVAQMERAEGTTQNAECFVFFLLPNPETRIDSAFVQPRKFERIWTRIFNIWYLIFVDTRLNFISINDNIIVL